MRHRFLASLSALAAVLIAIVFLAPVLVEGQAPRAAAEALTTPWGDPDLQGVWKNQTSTPLQRPAKFAGKEFLTDEELAEVWKAAIDETLDKDDRDQAPGTVTDVGRAYNAFWRSLPAKPMRRSSMIVDPPNGKLPPLTLEGRKRLADWAKAKGMMGSEAQPEGQREAERILENLGQPLKVRDGTEGGVDGRGNRADGPEDLDEGNRCISRGVPRLPAVGNNPYLRIVQTPGYVAIHQEMGNEVRIIPLDGRPHLPQHIRQWLGDSRGRWEGRTLVIDVTNKNDLLPFRGSFDGLHLVERLTRVDAGTINYDITVDDPTTWTRPWRFEFPLTSLQSLVGDSSLAKPDAGILEYKVPEIFEYACHEGNYGLTHMLSAARFVEKAEAAKKRKAARAAAKQR